MTINFDYTKYYPVNSSAVDAVFHNENDNTLVIDWDDELYRYSAVTKAEADAVAAGNYGLNTGGSVGRSCQNLKAAKGPGEYLGTYDEDEVYENRVEVKQSVGVPKDFVTTAGVTLNNVSTINGEPVGLPNGPTREYSLKTPAVETVNVGGALSGNDEEPTKEYSLRTPEAPAAAGLDDAAGETYTVFFTLDDGDREYEFNADDALDLEDALEELNEYVSRVGARGKVRRVVVNFA
jgi:hypothetical protein